jgi:diacylglycerol kinase (ATP)
MSDRLVVAKLVMVFELLNSTPASSSRPRFSPGERQADFAETPKDLASAVFLSVLLCAGIWLAAMWQRVSPCLKSRHSE